jgi:hypothetical protein
MRRQGRVNIVLLGAIAIAALLAFVLLFSRESVTAAGSRFMSALAKGDIDTLTDMTYLADESPEEIRRQWEFSAGDVSKHYMFAWKVLWGREADDNTASVRVEVMRNANSAASYGEPFELPLIKVDGKWKVDVANISRDMYPALPRAGMRLGAK